MEYINCPICDNERIKQEYSRGEVGRFITLICIKCEKTEQIFIPNQILDFISVDFEIK